jgi:hypothetical protein
MPAKSAKQKSEGARDALAAPRLPPSHTRRARSPSRSPSRARRSEMFEFLTPAALERMQRIRLVIDLDATFVSSHLDAGSYTTMTRVLKTLAAEKAVPRDVIEELERRIFVFDLSSTKVVTVLRPGTLEFIEFASLYFRSISVWSAGHRDYVEQIVSLLFPSHLTRPGIVFSWDECREEPAPEATGDRAASPSHSSYAPFTKPLSEFLEHISDGRASEPARVEETIILDDRDDIAIHNSGNLIKIPAFEPRIRAAQLLQPDYALDYIFNWLLRKEVLMADDVRTLRMSEIFESVDVRVPPPAPRE